MDKKRKAVIAGFFIFLLVMGICSLVTKGIYRARLPQVTTTVPREMSLYHPVAATGAVETGQEYGVYAPSGLRVAYIAVQRGDSFQEGEALLQLDVEDLKRILAEKELERQRQVYQQREAESQGAQSRREEAKTLTRALEDYETVRKNGELQISRAREDYLRAQAVLDDLRKQLDQARKRLEECRKEQEQNRQQETQEKDQGENAGDSVSGGDNVPPATPTDSEGSTQSDASTVLQQIAEQEAAIRQLQTQVGQQEEAVIAAAKSAEDAQLSHESGLLAAQRSVEDARAAAGSSYQAAADLAKLEQAYLEGEIQELQELIDAEGWIYAREGGRITQLCVGIGQRTPDTAQLLYTPDDGLRMLQARLNEEQAKYVSEGTRMQMNFETVSGGKQSREGIISYMEPQEDGSVMIQLDVTGQGMKLGQQVLLKSTWQSENYDLVVPISALHRDDNNSGFVYTLRQENGILGMEWHVVKLYVEVLDQNSRYAAIESGSLSPDSAIILTTTADLKENAVVRLVE